MIQHPILDFFSSQLFNNLLLLLTIVVALVVGFKQIALNDAIEIFATADNKTIVDAKTNTTSYQPIVKIQNVGTRLIYLDSYIFNGSEYITNGQVLPSGKDNDAALYWIDLPTNGTSHVSIKVYYHDLDGRNWESDVTADFSNNFWKVAALPTKKVK